MIAIVGMAQYHFKFKLVCTFPFNGYGCVWEASNWHRNAQRTDARTMPFASSIAFSEEEIPVHIQSCSRNLLDVDKLTNSRSFSPHSKRSAWAQRRAIWHKPLAADHPCACAAGGSSETPGGLPLGWEESAAEPRQDSQAQQYERPQAGLQRRQPSYQQPLHSEQAPQFASDQQVEAQRVQSGLTWAQQHIAGSRQQHRHASPRHASGDPSQTHQNYQNGVLAGYAGRPDGFPDHMPNSNKAMPYGAQAISLGHSFQGLDESMGGDSLFIATGGTPASRQDSVSLQWQLPQQPPRHAQRQLPASTANAASSPSPINRSELHPMLAD